MLPVAIVNNPIPVPIVNTTLPGTVITHVPYDNVAPPISNAQVNNNASPNSQAAAAEDQPNTAQTNIADETQIAAANSAAQTQPSAQAAFLAQLLSQDGSPPVQTILMQYEKLAALSNVKYKPSNAFMPVAEPSSTFGKILQENHPAAVAPPPSPPQPRQPAAQPSMTAEEEAVFSNSASAASHPARQQRVVTSYANNSPATPQIISAYTSTATRVDTQSAETVTESA